MCRGSKMHAEDLLVGSVLIALHMIVGHPLASKVTVCSRVQIQTLTGYTVE